MLSTAVFDLETSSLNGNEAILLVACFKSSEEGMITLRVDDADCHTWNAGLRGHDYGIVRQTAEVLSRHDVVVAHNGKWFDLPFLRTRLLKHGLPRLPDLKFVDPCDILRRKFRMKSNSLAAIIDHLGLKDKKTHLDMTVWLDAVLNGNRGSMDKIVKHCIQDVKALDGVFNAVKPYTKLIDDQGSAR